MMLTVSHGSINSDSKKTEYKVTALLGAFCLFLSAIEYMIPKPLPFMRIGIANMPIMLACDILSFPAFLLLILIKAFGQALITGTLFSYVFLFSITGTFFSAVLMFLLRKLLKKHITFIGLGTAGAVVSNISQLVLAYVFIFKDNVRYIAPPFLAVGLVTGIVLGIFCEVFARKSQWYKNKLNTEYTENTEKNEEGEKCCLNRSSPSVLSVSSVFKFLDNAFSARALFIAGLIIMPALLFNPSTEYRVLQFLFFWFLAVVCAKRTNPVVTILVTLFIIAFNLIIPYGKVLYSIGVFQITQGALEAGIHRAVTLQALIMLSKVTVRQDLKIPGAFGGLLGESLRIFSAITDRKYRITGKNIITEIDTLILELSDERITQKIDQQTKTKPAGYIILLIIIALSWLPWLNIIT